MTRVRLYILVLAFTAAGYGWTAWNLSAGSSGGGGTVPTPCLLKSATGVPCPSCGTTRSIEALAAGDVLRAAAVNPFGLVVAFGAVVFPPWVLWDLARRRDGFFRFFQAIGGTFASNRAAAAAGIALVLVNWGWNILKGL